MDYVDLTVNLAAEGNYSILYLVMLSWIHSKYACKQPNFTTQFPITNSQSTTAIEIIMNFIVIDQSMLVDEPEVICIQPDSVTLQDDLQAEMYRAECENSED